MVHSLIFRILCTVTHVMWIWNPDWVSEGIKEVQTYTGMHRKAGGCEKCTHW